MSQQHMWNRLEQADLVSGEQPEFNEKQANLWYVRAMQGFAGWLAAIFLIGFLGFGVAGLFDNGVALMIMGLVITFSSYVYFKSKPDSDFFEQLVLVFSLTGQFLFTFGLFQLFDFKNQQWVMIVAVYQVALVWLVDHWLHRFLSAWFAAIALFWAFGFLMYSGLGSAMLAFLFVWLWLDKIGWQAEKKFYEPIAYASALALLQFNIPHGFGTVSLYWYRYTEPNWLMLNGHLIAATLNSMVLLYFVYRMMQEQGLGYSSKTGKLTILAAVLLLFTALPVMGLSSAVLVLLVGFARRNQFLLVLGILALLGFVSWYYYSLNTTLLNKSLILLAAGLVLVIGYFLVRYAYKNRGPIQSVGGSEISGLSRWQKLAAVLTLALVLVGVNHAIVEKEGLLANGQSVFLELAPVDPRSLMQGDYMRLRFAIANEIRNQHREASADAEENLDGYVWVTLDDKGVGSFYSTSDDGGVEQHVVKMQYRIRDNRVQFATNAFFFQEGDAKLFDQAKYGAFKVSDDGELLLKAMYDQNLKLLGENRLD